MFDPTKPCCRRDGKSARIAYSFKNGDYLVVYDWRDGVKELVYRINKDGYYREGGHCGYGEHEADLVNIPEKIEGWIGVTRYMVHETAEEANKCALAANMIYDAFIKVSFTEGGGLSND